MYLFGSIDSKKKSKLVLNIGTLVSIRKCIWSVVFACALRTREYGTGPF